MSRKKSRKGAQKPIGIMVLLMSTGALILAVTFFLSKNLVVMQFDFSGEEDYFGWVFVALSMVLSTTALVLFIRMPE